MGHRISQLNRRRFETFRHNRRGYWSFWIFSILFVLSLGAELIANDKPILVQYEGKMHFPAFKVYPETVFGGDFEVEADYTDEFVQDLINEKGSMIWPPIRFSYDTVDFQLDESAPTAPDRRHLLGTDDQARDVLARVIYGFRISVLFGLLLTLFSTVIGVTAGAVQGYFGGWLDLIFASTDHNGQYDQAEFFYTAVSDDIVWLDCTGRCSKGRVSACQKL